MNTLLRKELRLLLPAWVAALAVATLPLWTGRNYQGAIMPCFDLAVLFLGLTPFGQEMSCGTFGLLLSQPEKRQRFWKIKAGLLALAMLSAWAVFVWCGWLSRQFFFYDFYFDSFTDMAVGSGVATLVAFSSGLWSTLLLRDLTTAFFAAVMAPAALLMATFLASLHWIDNDALMERVVFCVMTAYSALGFFVARRLFLGAEDVPLAWTGRQISLPKVRGLPLRWLGFGLQKRRGPCSALIFKELRMQEVTMVLLPLLAFLHLAALGARHFAPEWAARKQVLDFAGFLWLAAPFVVGCVAVAEERRYNTLESLLCLPVRKRNQFLVKFAVVMALGIALGGLVPWVLENVGGDSRQWIGFGPLRGLVSAAAGMAAASFFASTMSRGMLQAFTVGLLFPILLLTAVGILLPKFGLGSAVISFGGLLFPALAVPSFLIAYFWMAFRNYKLLQTGWPLWAGNLIRVFAVFASVLLVASAIYARSWEYFMPLEPRHGPARLSGPGQAIIAGAGGDQCFYALLPDGRLWAGKTDRARPDRQLKNLSGRFVAGSNWVDLAATYTEGAAALKSDGTLWKFSRRAGSGQIGSDSDWKKVVAAGSFFLALKQNGTIWGWGYDGSGILPGHLNTNGRPDAIPGPVQLWQDSDWVDVFAKGQPMAVKRDGSLWTWGYDGKPVSGRITNYSVYHRLVRADLEGTNWASLAGDDWLTMGVRTDGTLWAGAQRPLHINPADRPSIPTIFGSQIPRGGVLELGHIGTKSDWVGVSMDGDQFLAIEADGTFWAINRNSFQTQHPSRYQDWLAASGGFLWENWALAKDGTISCWRDVFQLAPDDYEGPYNDGKSHFFSLRPSRRPLASINILGAK
jgi:hypothetical protein